MNLSLRNRILTSYILLLTVTFSIVIFSLLVFLSTSPEPLVNTYRRLSPFLTELTDINTIAEQYFEAYPDAQTITRLELYQAYSEWNDIRLLIVNPANERVLFDSQDRINVSDTLRINYEVAPNIQLRAPGLSVIAGSFRDSNRSDWVFIGIQNANNRENADSAILVASERTQGRSLQSALAEFGNSLAVPILQAGLIGAITAFLFAAFISRTIANPLQKIAAAARRIAQGDYQQKVDVTGAPEIRYVAEAFNHMSDEVSSTQQAQRDFMANVSHDLKTPLTSIQGYSQAIMDGTVKDPTTAASIIFDESSRLSRMVAALTDLARLQAGGATMQYEAINLHQLIHSVIQRLAVLAKQQHILVDLQGSKSATIQGDGDRLVQVFTNLISNAIKYNFEGGIVTINISETAQTVTISIKDTGIGLPADESSRIFERFYQVDKARGPSRGTGLGLAITQEIIAAHHGQINVHSEGINQGTSFTVQLPKQQSNKS